MQAIVLAAGLGTRLWPLTADRAKPAVPFLGRPLVAGLVDWIRPHVDRIVVNTHHRPESVRAALEGHDVAFSHEVEILGTAGALAHARDAGLLSRDVPTLIANGKLFTQVQVGRLLEHHVSTGAAVTLGLRANPKREHFREVHVRDGVVTGYGEGRVPEGPSPLLFTGLHVVSPEVLAATAPKFSDTIRDVYPPFLAAGRVHACRLDEGRWWEFSTLERYHGLHVQAHVEGLGPDVVCSPGASVASDRVSRSVLWSGAHVEAGARVEGCVLGENVTVRRGETFEDLVLVDRTILGSTTPERGRSQGSRWCVPLAAT
ncbi:MAG: NDP-sugar synthase [Deltaproteobacteria bacterium]